MTAHKWTAFITVELTEQEIDRIRLTGQLHLTNISEQRATANAATGCMVCERQLVGESRGEIARLIDSPCPGEPKGYAADGSPTW